METKNAEQIRETVRKRYAEVACGQHPQPNACGEKGGCCEQSKSKVWSEIATDLGYTNEDIRQAPQGSNMGLGCGNPLTLASLQQGETVLDLGSGGGFDCFLAARAVGENGRVIGVDMTPEMVSKARAAADREKIENVEFRLGEIEHLPVADQSIDVIISNCVINLSPQKQQVFDEAFRVLKNGGRLTVSDIVATSPLPAETKKDLALISACMGGAEEVENLNKMLIEAGFQDVRIEIVEGSESMIATWLPEKDFGGSLASAKIAAVKPLQTKNDNKRIKKKVYGHYQSGLHCAEVISRTILETFSTKEHPEAVKAAAGFGGGIAGSLEGLCGAFTGGIIAISALLGRDKPGDDLRDCATIITAYKNRFLSQFGSIQCVEAVAGFGGITQMNCVRLTAEAALILNDLLREFEQSNDLKLENRAILPREKVELGHCPFSTGATFP